MNPALRVEPDESGTLRVAGKRLRFDASSGTVRAELDAGVFVVKPLLWRSKRALARFTRMGDEFVREQVLSVSVEGDLPLDPEARRELWAVVAWLNAPGIGFESGALSQVTLDVCRAAGLAPRDLDEREAWEVESLWHASRRDDEPRADQARSASRADDGLNRILVVPDPATRRTGPPATASNVERSAVDARNEGQAANEAARTSTPSSGESGPATRSPNARGSGTAPHEPRPNGRDQRSSSLRFRVLPAASREPAGKARATAAQDRFSVSSASTPSLIDSDSDSVAFHETPRGEQLPPSMGGRPARSTLHSHGSSVAAAVIPSAAPMSSAVPARFTLPRVDSASPALPQALGQRAEPLDTEALFDELSDRFEQAAAELGIDLEE
jgi:hypothetical protein